MEYVYDKLFINYSCKWWELIRCDRVVILVPLWSQVYCCLPHVHDNIYSSFFRNSPCTERENTGPFNVNKKTHKADETEKRLYPKLTKWEERCGSDLTDLGFWKLIQAGVYERRSAMDPNERRVRGEGRTRIWAPVKEGSEEKAGLGFGGGTWATMNEWLVDVGGQESWVGVPVHQCVDL